MQSKEQIWEWYRSGTESAVVVELLLDIRELLNKKTRR